MQPPSAEHPVLLRGAASARVTLAGRELINFAGSTYLALGGLPELRDAAQKALADGAAFSCQLPAAYGTVDPFIQDAESAAAEYCGTQAAVYFTSGYLIGAVALSCLDTAGSVLFIDEGAHFSLFDAARLTGRPVVPFKHCDPQALARAIRGTLPPGERPIVVSDGVFGTTGRVAPLQEYAAVIAGYDGRLIVDEAHSFGVLGPRGCGAADLYCVESVAMTAATLSKAFCAQGAIICCDSEVAEKLRRVAPLRGANAGSPISAAVAAAALRYMRANPARRARLAHLTHYLRNKLRGIGIEVGDSPAPIFTFRIEDRSVMTRLQKRLFERGIYVLVSNYLGAGAEGVIRCAVFADHSEADLDALADGLGAIERHTPQLPTA